MRPDIYWIEAPLDGRLAIMPRPRGGDWLEDEIAGLRMAGVDMVVSLLDPDEVAELALEDEAELCRANAIEFISFPIADRGVPISIPETVDLVRTIMSAVRDAKSVVVHCRAGIGRSALIAACALFPFGFDSETAFSMIGRARGMRVPDTDEQQVWAAEFGRAAL